MYDINFSSILKWMPQLIDGCLITVYISSCAMLVGCIIGILVGTCSSFKTKFLKYINVFYIELFRGTPLLVQLFFIYFGLGQLGLKLNPIQAGIVTLSLNTGAYVSEIIRAAIFSIDKGQYEASLSLGMTKFQAIRYVILPQGLRIAIPPLVNTFSAILKDSSLVSTIAVVDLTRVGQQIYTTTFRPFEVFATIGLLYLFINVIIVICSKALERKIRFKLGL